jgi:hypothetical protein
MTEYELTKQIIRLETMVEMQQQIIEILQKQNDTTDTNLKLMITTKPTSKQLPQLIKLTQSTRDSFLENSKYFSEYNIKQLFENEYPALDRISDSLILLLCGNDKVMKSFFVHDSSSIQIVEDSVVSMISNEEFAQKICMQLYELCSPTIQKLMDIAEATVETELETNVRNDDTNRVSNLLMLKQTDWQNKILKKLLVKCKTICG